MNPDKHILFKSGSLATIYILLISFKPPDIFTNPAFTRHTPTLLHRYSIHNPYIKPIIKPKLNNTTSNKDESLKIYFECESYTLNVQSGLKTSITINSINS